MRCAAVWKRCYLVRLMLACGIAGLLSSCAVAQPIRWFGSVQAGCDNFGRCSVWPAMPDPPGDPVSIYLERAGSADAPLEISFRVNRPVEGGVAARLQLGEQTFDLEAAELSTRRDPDGGRLVGYQIAAARVDELVGAMRRVRSGRLKMAVSGQDQERIVLLDGLDEALRHLDARQGRVGARDALIDRGPRAASDTAVPKPLPAKDTWPKEIAAIFRRETCSDRLATFGEMAEGFVATPAPGRELWAIACDGGNYNIEFILVEIRNRDAGTARLLTLPTRLHRRPDRGATNPNWWDARNELWVFERGRSHGDCGVIARYRWTPQGFRLLDQRRKDDCDAKFTDPWTSWKEVGALRLRATSRLQRRAV